VNGKAEEKDWSATRQTKNANTKQGIENPTSADIRCYSSAKAANVVTVPAGATIHYISTQQVNHPGPTQYYLAKAPVGADVKTWDGSGAVWFRFSTTMPTVNSAKQMSWPGQSTFPPPFHTSRILTAIDRRIQNPQHHHSLSHARRRLPSPRRAHRAAYGDAGEQSAVLSGLLADSDHGWRHRDACAVGGASGRVQE
jgi:hypothetical protein